MTKIPYEANAHRDDTNIPRHFFTGAQYPHKVICRNDTVDGIALRMTRAIMRQINSQEVDRLINYHEAHGQENIVDPAQLILEQLIANLQRRV